MPSWNNTIVGLMFNLNEGDILAEVITEAMPYVDSLFIADDGSTDESWKIIQSFKLANPDKIEHIQRDPNQFDKGQKQSLLTEIKRRYKPENTWVQVMESDIMILDSNIRAATESYAVEDIGVTWHLINGTRESWDGIDTYPYWGNPIKEIMPKGGYMERMLYTFRPLPKINYDSDFWRPWPRGFTHYVGNTPVKVNIRDEKAPLLGHYGFRGPTHFYKKNKGKKFRKYPTWDTSSIDSIKETVYFFNGTWNKARIAMSRRGWEKWIESKKKARET